MIIWNFFFYFNSSINIISKLYTKKKKRLLKLSNNHTLILDALLVSGGNTKKYNIKNNSKYSEHSGLLDFDENSVVSKSDYNGYSLSCNGSNNGFIDVTVSGGTGVYTYAWSNGLFTEDLIDLGAGIYNVVATDSNGCAVSESFVKSCQDVDISGIIVS